MSVKDLAVVHFDYESLDKKARDVVLEKTAEIRERFNRAAENIVEIGQRLLDVKAALPHGTFQKWLEMEFDWEYSTANRMMNVANTFKSPKLGDLKNIAASPSALYLIASESTPSDIRDIFRKRVMSGDPVTCLEVRTAIESSKPTVESDRPDLRTLASEIGEDDEPDAPKSSKQYINGETGEEIDNLVTVTTKETKKSYSISQAKFDEITNALAELETMSKKSSHQVSMIEVRRIVERAIKAFSGVGRIAA